MVEKYFLTCMEKDGSSHYLTESGKDSGWPDFGDEYSYGYFSSLDEAIKNVNEDAGSVYKGVYKYVLIEKMDAGIHPLCLKDTRWWFKYNGATNQYEATEEAKGICYCNFALG